MSRWLDRSAIILMDMVLISTIIFNTAKSSIIRCEEAKLRCAYRTGCGTALQHYFTGCAPVLQSNDCSETCQHALIALTSTDEGKELMTVHSIYLFYYIFFYSSICVIFLSKHQFKYFIIRYC